MIYLICRCVTVFHHLNVSTVVVRYWTNMVTAFDGVIVITSFVEIFLDGSGAMTAFRGFRLLRIFKLAKKWTSFRVLVTRAVALSR